MADLLAVHLVVILGPGDLFASKDVQWPAVPRIGEVVEIGDGEHPADVTQVTWSMDGSVEVELEAPTAPPIQGLIDLGWTLTDEGP